MKTNEIIFAADCSENIINALVAVYQNSTYQGGQHDLTTCRICHAEQNWGGNGRGWNLTHKPLWNGQPCPVGTLETLLQEFYKEG